MNVTLGQAAVSSHGSCGQQSVWCSCSLCGVVVSVFFVHRLRYVQGQNDPSLNTQVRGCFEYYLLKLSCFGEVVTVCMTGRSNNYSLIIFLLDFGTMNAHLLTLIAYGRNEMHANQISPNFMYFHRV